ITEPYWARVKIDGVYQDVLFQLFERRALTYVPSMPKGWQVQMVNVGQHYYRWLYGGPLPTPLVPLATPLPNIPDAVDATIVPSVQPGYGPPNGQFTFSARGLAGSEPVQVKFTDPNGSVVYPANSNNGQYTAGADGVLQFTLQPDQAFPAAPLGVWLFELHGV